MRTSGFNKISPDLSLSKGAVQSYFRSHGPFVTVDSRTVPVRGKGHVWPGADALLLCMGAGKSV